MTFSSFAFGPVGTSKEGRLWRISRVEGVVEYLSVRISTSYKKKPLASFIITVEHFRLFLQLLFWGRSQGGLKGLFLRQTNMATVVLPVSKIHHGRITSGYLKVMGKLVQWMFYPDISDAM